MPPGPEVTEAKYSMPTKGGAPTVLKPGWGFGKEPPKLVVAINEVTDPPDGTKYDKNKNPSHSLAPHEAASIKEILTAIRTSLDDDFKDEWTTQKPTMARWKSSDSEENWAEMFLERFTLITYSGPGLGYFDVGGWDAYICARMQPKARPNQRYVLGGTSYGVAQVKSWKDPETLVDLGVVRKTPAPLAPVANADPAIPIIGACQHSATYVGISRGLTIEDDLQNAGYAASQSTATLPIFSGKAAPGYNAPAKTGTFYMLDVPVQAGGKIALQNKGADDTPQTTMADLRRPSFATDPAKLSPSLGPGTIFTFNPHGFMSGTVPLYLCDWEMEYDPARNKIRKAVFEHLDGDISKAASSEYAKPDRQPGKPPLVMTMPLRMPHMTPEEYDAKCKEASDSFNAQWNKWSTPAAIKVKPYAMPIGTDQESGSHINVVLRVSNDKDPKDRSIQMYDASSSLAFRVMETDGARGLVVRPIQGGIIEGCAIPSQPELKGPDNVPECSPCTGMGVIPDTGQLEAMTSFLKNARPIGLCRLVLTARQLPPTAAPSKRGAGAADVGARLNVESPKPGDVIYMSRVLRMYGDSASQNFYLSKLLRSLRFAPGFANIQAWWFALLPKGLLSKCMYAPDGRAMRAGDFVSTVLLDSKRQHVQGSKNIWVNQTGLVRQRHYVVSHVFTNCGDEPGRAGKAYVWMRWHILKANTIDGLEPPKEILKLMDQYGIGEYVHSAIKDEVVPKPDANGSGSDGLDWFRYG
jgi:hypothetical protein